jgi:hypothetical protein
LTQSACLGHFWGLNVTDGSAATACPNMQCVELRLNPATLHKMIPTANVVNLLLNLLDSSAANIFGGSANHDDND